MTLTQTWTPKAPPLREDESGTVRIGKTRVTLDTIIAFYLQGMTAEALAEAFDTVALADIHSVISYYLQNKDDVDAYLAQRSREAEEMRQRIEAKNPPGNMREKLLQRRRERASKNG